MLRLFEKKLNLSSRNSWKKVEIRDQLIRGRLSEAKANYITDVIADTQYLYGILDSPLVTGKSALSRTGFIFQSWWMNYATTLEKWIRTGKSGVAKTDRLFTAMTSAAIGYTLMEPLFGSKRAIGAIGLGPLPGGLGEQTIPPAWTPIYHSLAAIINLQQPEITARHLKRITSLPWIFVPGGFQLRSMIKGSVDEGFEGFLKSIVGFKRGEEE